MSELQGKKVVVVGGSQGIGRETVRAAHAAGAQVLAVARRENLLAELAQEIPGVQTLSADATEDATVAGVFDAMTPDVLVLCGGALPVQGAVQDLTWEQFSVVWNGDLKSSFLFCQAALKRPLAPGSTVVILSSGAGLGGSFISGGYAGAKRMQMFLAQYCQKQSDKLNLGIRFVALVPMRIMPETTIGKRGVEGYSMALGISVAEYMKDREPSQTPAQVAEAALQLATETPLREGNVFSVSATGLGALP